MVDQARPQDDAIAAAGDVDGDEGDAAVERRQWTVDAALHGARLDKDTSGLMVVGRTLAAVTALTRAIAAREVQRRYLAVAQGTPPDERWTIEAPIGRDARMRTRMAIVAAGKPARTDVERVAVAKGFAALCCTLHSGRTHQIRVHLAA